MIPKIVNPVNDFTLSRRGRSSPKDQTIIPERQAKWESMYAIGRGEVPQDEQAVIAIEGTNRMVFPTDEQCLRFGKRQADAKTVDGHIGWNIKVVRKRIRQHGRR